MAAARVRRPARDRRPRRLSGAAFVRGAIANARLRAPRAHGPYRTAVWSYIGKLWTGNRDLHYEIWLRPRPGVVELGLHFESDGVTNARLLGAFRAREAEIHRQLGHAPVLEPWDRGWARVYETRRLSDDSRVAEECGARLAEYVSVLEPILREELPVDADWDEPR